MPEGQTEEAIYVLFLFRQEKNEKKPTQEGTFQKAVLLSTTPPKIPDESAYERLKCPDFRPAVSTHRSKVPSKVRAWKIDS